MTEGESPWTAGQTPLRDSPIGVISVTYSPGDSLAEMLDSLTVATTSAVRIILVDNGSTDGSVEASSARADVQLLRTGSNLGYGRAANEGFRALPADVAFVLLINPDVVLFPGALDELIAVARRFPRAGAVGPLITTAAGLVYPSARRLPSVGVGIGHALLGWCWSSNPWTSAYRQDQSEPVEREAGWLSGACVLLRRNAMTQIGGFDPGYFMYFEDVDLGDRLGAAGWQNIYAPSARAMHTGGHSTSKHAAAMSQAHHRSAYRYLARRYSRWWHTPLRVLLRAGLALRAAVARRSTQISDGATLPDRHA
ncbi:MAG: glycosyltransferase family 2 protein [Actinomycetota bacterium]|nr:glycosyltransferase family 2 protein [Actinomycetota bacterium]